MSYETQAPGDIGYNGFPVSLSYFVAVPEAQLVEDPNIAVLFKSLSKKNIVTREKNLIDLIKILRDSSNAITDNVIVCWIQLYPKLALDNSKPVRLLAHQVQGTLLRRVGGREFGKYLKSTIPLWLSSVFDPDSSVSNGTYKELLESFQNDKDRVDTKLWQVFCDQIVNYIYVVVCVENDESLSDPRYVKKEDSVAKYERALAGAFLMLCRLIDMRNSKNLEISEEAMLQINKILLLDEIWKQLETCTEPETINVALFKAYIALLKKIFVLDENNAPSQIASQLDDMKSFYKLVSKRLIKSVKIKAVTNTQPIIYSNVIIQFWDLLNTLTTFTLMTAESRKSFKIKKNFWELAGSKAHSRLIGYIKLGHCNSDAIYYNVVRSFFRNASAVELRSDEEVFMDFNSSKDAKSVIQAFISQFPSLPSLAYKASAIECIFSTAELFPTSNTQELKKEAFLVALDGLSSSRVRQNEVDAREKALASLAKNASVVDSNDINKDLCESLKTGEMTILGHRFKNDFESVTSTYVSILDADSTHQLLDTVLLALSDIFEKIELHRAFEVILSCIQKGYSTEFKEWVPLLPSFCTPGFTDLPFKVLRIILENEVESVDYKELVSDIFTKISTDVPEAVPSFLDILRRSPLVSEADLPEVKAYLNELSLSKSKNASNEDIVYEYLNDPTILQNLLLSSKVEEDPSSFVNAVIKSSISLSDLEEESKDRLSMIIVKSFPVLSAEKMNSFLDLIGDALLVSRTLFEELNLEDGVIVNKLASIVSGHEEYFPVKEVSDRINNAVEKMDISTIAISNPLSQNVYLAESQSTDLEIDFSLLSIAKVLLSLLQSDADLDDELIRMGLLLNEYLEDAVFLANGTFPVDLAMNVKKDLETTLETHLSSSAISLDAFFEGTSTSGVLVNLLEGISKKQPYSVCQIYSARFITRMLTSEIEKMNLNEFDNANMNVAKLANQPLKLAIFLSSGTKFLGASKKFDRLRNFVFGEILGVKSSDILGLGRMWLALAINFLNVSNEEFPEYQVLPSHKMGMVVNHLTDWLDSDVAYEDDFLCIRSLLASFCTKLMSLLPENAPEVSPETAFDLCLNNLSSAQLNPKNLDLRLSALRLCNVLLKSTDDRVDMNDARRSLIEELCDFMLNDDLEKYNTLHNNQPVKLASSLLKRIFSSIELPRSIIADNFEKYLEKLNTSATVDMQRSAASLLQREIFATRDDFVVEYQLSKSKLSDSQDDLTKAQLPEVLIQATINFDKDLEVLIEQDQEHIAYRYLWSWLLIFAYFKDSTYDIRTDFIRQLAEHQSIEHLLNVIFDHVQISDSRFLKTLTTGNLEKSTRVNPEECLISEYSIARGCLGEDSLYEMRFLLVHLYYLGLRYLGSPSLQWFNELRDLQLKREVEKFSAKFISPILISEMLNDVDKSKSKLTSKDENFTIKVNKTINEIRSVYIIDEQRMEMVVKVPETFPLSSVLVLGPLRLGVNEKQWKAWLLASQRVVSLTNGSIIDCIELFNRNVNLHFSGFEECAICYSILHQDHSLPSKTCLTCLNKFHAACLYKWFKSSGSSTCPLCRTAFNFRATRS